MDKIRRNRYQFCFGMFRQKKKRCFFRRKFCWNGPFLLLSRRRAAFVGGGCSSAGESDQDPTWHERAIGCYGLTSNTFQRGQGDLNIWSDGIDGWIFVRDLESRPHQNKRSSNHFFNFISKASFFSKISLSLSKKKINMSLVRWPQVCLRKKAPKVRGFFWQSSWKWSTHRSLSQYSLGVGT